MTVAPDDVDGIARALTAAVDGRLAASYSPRELEQYMYPRPAEAVAELVEQVLARRA